MNVAVPPEAIACHSPKSPRRLRRHLPLLLFAVLHAPEHVTLARFPNDVGNTVPHTWHFPEPASSAAVTALFLD